MNNQDYQISFTVDSTPTEVFKSINQVTAWWTPNLEGESQKLGDEFTVRFGDLHITKQRLIEVVPDEKVVWLITESNLSFVEDKQEWTNTKVSFELAHRDGKTEVFFTHIGLVPPLQCYKSCTKGWDFFIKGSLYKLLTEGKGTPGAF